MPPISIIITCEHASNFIPKPYRHLFIKELEILDTHQGYDIGALSVAKRLKKDLNAVLFHSQVSRLLIDSNRSIHHHNCFSRFTKKLIKKDKDLLAQKYYHYHLSLIFQEVEKKIQSKQPVLHLAIHSFTPQLHGETRNNDIGFLYDPKRENEKKICTAWKKSCSLTQPNIKIRMNYPYKGNTDCLAANLRKKWMGSQYMGIEVELNQKLMDSHFLKKIYIPLLSSLQSILSQF